ncbi:MAG: hypothetical protein WBL11_01255 [Bacteroidales bacterium]|jgi:hypothetical protein|nr:lipocalin family protein [Bacteroidales bacterium]MDD3755000.1 lipocalin family protein [Bacteroidales bacterium]MDI9575980.1 lipocalin family protein [Bacteroidota bacterium]HHW59675.1 hypothetical protein [Bacteroidales bacterium]
MKKLSVILLIVIASITISGCKDKDKNNDSQEATKTTLLCKKWKIEKIYMNGQERQDLLNLMSGMVWEFKKDGTFTIYLGTSIASSGTWNFNNDETQINLTVTYEQGENLEEPINDIFYILKLNESQLWVRDDQNTDSFEYHFIPLT